jgi:ribA/ribD-fused uncharacterized protein
VIRGASATMAAMDPSAALDRLLADEVAERLPPFLCFWGHEARAEHAGPWVLSQWWPVAFEVDGVTYRHAEGFMMSEKARLFGDEEAAARIVDAPHPGEAKKLGREVRGFEEATWERAAFDIVVRGNLAKFGQHDDLRAYLVATAPKVLVEASPVDRIWGIGLAGDDVRARVPSEWRGRNLLGFALMAVREELRQSR